MNSNNNVKAFICAVTGAGLSLFQTVLSIPFLELDLSVSDFLLFQRRNVLFSASCIILAVAVFAALCGLFALLRKGKGFYVWGLAICSAVHVSAIIIYMCDVPSLEAFNTTFQSWYKTYLVWAACFFIAALCAFIDYKALSQQNTDTEDTSPDALQTDELGISPQEEQKASPADITSLTEKAYTFLRQGNFHDAEHYYKEILKHNHENSAAYLGQLMAQLRVRDIDSLSNTNIQLTENHLFQLAMLFANDDQRTALQNCLDKNTQKFPCRS